MVKIPTEPLLFDLYYGGASTTLDEVPVTEETPQFKDIYINNVVCHGAARAMFFNGLPEMNVSNVNINNVTIVANRGAEIVESDGVKLNNVRVIAAQGPNLILHNAKNIEIANFTGNEDELPKINISGKNSKTVNILGKYEVLVDESANDDEVKRFLEY